MHSRVFTFICRKMSDMISGACKSSTPCSIFCLGLTQSLFFYCSSSVVCTLDSMLLCCLSQVTSRTRWCHIDDPQSFTLRTRWFRYHIPLKFILRTWLWDCHKTATHALSTFHKFSIAIQQIQMYLWYDIWTHTHIREDTACAQHVNVGFTQACPNYVCLALYVQS